MGGKHATSLALVLYVAAYVVFSTTGLIVLKRALVMPSGARHLSLGALANARVGFGLVLYAISFLIWVGALRYFALGTIYPVFLGAGLVGVAVGSRLFLAEPFVARQVVGTAIVFGGILLLTRSG